MENLTGGILLVNYTEPKLPENPIRYSREEKTRIETLMLMMAPLWVMSAWFIIYVLIIIFNYTCDAVKIYVLKDIRRQLVQGNLNVKKDVRTVLKEYFTDMQKVKCENVYL